LTPDVDQVLTLIDNAVDVLWPHKNGTRSWDSLRPSDDDMSDSCDNVTARCHAAYRRLVFDLTAQSVNELYNNVGLGTSVDLVSQPWRQPKLLSRRVAPASADLAKPHIRALVLRQLRLDGNSHQPIVPRYSGGSRATRRRADRVDQLLWAELREEETVWTDYTNDELFVKMQVTELLFDMLLTETVAKLTEVTSTKHRQQ
jgi:hypothetical protein